MTKCDICNKNMPPNILAKHKILRHTEPVAEVKVPSDITSLGEPKKFDFGELNTCQQCKEEYPSKIMEFHMHVRHGM